MMTMYVHMYVKASSGTVVSRFVPHSLTVPNS